MFPGKSLFFFSAGGGGGRRLGWSSLILSSRGGGKGLGSSLIVSAFEEGGVRGPGWSLLELAGGANLSSPPPPISIKTINKIWKLVGIVTFLLLYRSV